MIDNKYRIVFDRNFMEYPRPCKNFILIQTGESLCPKDSIINEHYQQWFEISFVSDGSGIITADSYSTNVKKNDCFLSFPGERHSIIAKKDSSLRYIFLAFYAKERTYENKLIEKITELSKLTQTHYINLESLQPLLVNVLQEMKNSDAFSSRILGDLLEQILILIYRKLLKTTHEPYSFKQSNKEVLSYDIISYIDKNLTSITQLSDLEKIFFYKLQYLSKIFKAQTGVSIKDYLIAKKMDHATKLLKEGKSVTEVSETLNYYSVHSFSRAYTNYYGQRPSSLKKDTPPQK